LIIIALYRVDILKHTDVKPFCKKSCQIKQNFYFEQKYLEIIKKLFWVALSSSFALFSFVLMRDSVDGLKLNS